MFTPTTLSDTNNNTNQNTLNIDSSLVTTDPNDEFEMIDTTDSKTQRLLNILQKYAAIQHYIDESFPLLKKSENVQGMQKNIAQYHQKITLLKEIISLFMSEELSNFSEIAYDRFTKNLTDLKNKLPGSRFKNDVSSWLNLYSMTSLTEAKEYIKINQLLFKPMRITLDKLNSMMTNEKLSLEILSQSIHQDNNSVDMEMIKGGDYYNSIAHALGGTITDSTQKKMDVQLAKLACHIAQQDVLAPRTPLDTYQTLYAALDVYASLYLVLYEAEKNNDSVSAGPNNILLHLAVIQTLLLTFAENPTHLVAKKNAANTHWASAPLRQQHFSTAIFSNTYERLDLFSVKLASTDTRSTAFTDLASHITSAFSLTDNKAEADDILKERVLTYIAGLSAFLQTRAAKYQLDSAVTCQCDAKFAIELLMRVSEYALSPTTTAHMKAGVSNTVIATPHNDEEQVSAPNASTTTTNSENTGTVRVMTLTTRNESETDDDDSSQTSKGCTPSDTSDDDASSRTSKGCTPSDTSDDDEEEKNTGNPPMQAPLPPQTQTSATTVVQQFTKLPSKQTPSTTPTNNLKG